MTWVYLIVKGRAMVITNINIIWTQMDRLSHRWSCHTSFFLHLYSRTVNYSKMLTSVHQNLKVNKTQITPLTRESRQTTIHRILHSCQLQIQKAKCQLHYFDFIFLYNFDLATNYIGTRCTLINLNRLCTDF